jgi:hypothetical protein
MLFLDEIVDFDAGEFVFPSELGRNFRRNASIGSSCFELLVDAEAEDDGFRSV